MASPGFLRSLSRRLLIIGTVVISLIVLYSTVESPTSLRLRSSFLSSLTEHPSCPPHAYANGSWEYAPKTSQSSMEKQEDALNFSGFEGCASSREYWWHLASDNEGQWGRFPGAQSWEWVPGSDECRGLRRLDPSEMVRDLVEEGGWLLLGDSITEGHFFSLSCLLYPHVIATPDYNGNSGFDRAWPQHLHLSPTSPLLSSLSFPAGFNITLTPLVTFRRVDLLLTQDELVSLHQTVHRADSTALVTNFSVFSDEAAWSLSPEEYMPLFTSPLPQGNYATMVVSTAGHWTTNLFSGFKDEGNTDTDHGYARLIDFFSKAMKHWADEVQGALARDFGVMVGPGRMSRRTGRGRARRSRKVVVRAYLPGHEDCHNHREPWKDIVPFVWGWYNWGRIWKYNEVFERILKNPKYSNIHYLPIDVPGRLRPDAHTTSDCLHIMAGAGVLEGWSHYIWHYVTREI